MACSLTIHLPFVLRYDDLHPVGATFSPLTFYQWNV
jgi:hypothetical protein